MTDRTELEKAIAGTKALHAYLKGYQWDAAYKSGDGLAAVIAAAQAHLDTLPKTKMVEVWHVEWAERLHYEGEWRPRLVGPFINKGMAQGCADDLGSSKLNAWIKVTGPHLQTVPAS